MTTVFALSHAWKIDIALVVVFFVVFPALAHGLIGLAVGQSMAEREQNRRYREGLDDE